MSNDFLPFATGGGANVIDQPTYAGAAVVGTGFQSGIADSRYLNKVWRQSSFIASCFAQYMANTLGVSILDDGVVANMLAHIGALLGNIVGGAANEIPYQTAANTTAFIPAPGAAGDVLQWNGTNFVWVAGGGGDVVHWNNVGVSGANAAGTGWLVGGNGINKQWVNQTVTAAGDGPTVTVTYPNATLFASTAYVKSLVVIDPGPPASGPSNSLISGVISQSLTGCVIYLGENGGGTRTVTIQLTVEGE